MAEPAPDIVRRAQQGDSRAVADLVAGQQKYVYSLAMALLKDPADAADLTQEAFIRLLRVLPSYRGETRFTTWLYRLVVNLGLDQLRARNRSVESLETDAGDQALDVPDTSRLSDPLAAVTEAEAAERVRQALATLPVAQRLALTMYYFDGMRYEDIGQAMGIPLNTVKSHIRRGKERLAKILQQVPSCFEQTKDSSGGAGTVRRDKECQESPCDMMFCALEGRYHAV